MRAVFVRDMISSLQMLFLERKLRPAPTISHHRDIHQALENGAAHQPPENCQRQPNTTIFEEADVVEIRTASERVQPLSRCENCTEQYRNRGGGLTCEKYAVSTSE